MVEGGMAVVEMGLLSWHTLARSLNLSDEPINLTHPSHHIPHVEVKPYNSSRTPLVALLGVLAFMTALGNSFVIYAVARKKYLHSSSTILLASLAAGDLIVGALIMPVAILELALDHWPLGTYVCDVYHALDVFASTVSIWSLTRIAVDRREAVEKPVQHSDLAATVRSSLVHVTLIWLISAAISFPGILYWRLLSPHNYLQPLACPFTDSVPYIIASSALSFYFPLGIILCSYWQVFKAASKHTSALRLGRKRLSSQRSPNGHNGSRSSTTRRSLHLRMHRGGASHSPSSLSRQDSDVAHLHRNVSAKGSRMTISTQLSGDSSYSLHGMVMEHKVIEEEASGSQSASSAHPSQVQSPQSPVALEPPREAQDLRRGSQGRKASRSLSSKRLKKSPPEGRRKSLAPHLSRLLHEQRAAKMLGLVIGAFTVCWLPFFTVNCINALCPVSCIGDPGRVFEIVTWLGYLNSFLNPFIYTYFNRELQRALRETFGGRKRSRESQWQRRSRLDSRASTSYFRRRSLLPPPVLQAALPTFVPPPFTLKTSVVSRI